MQEVAEGGVQCERVSDRPGIHRRGVDRGYIQYLHVIATAGFIPLLISRVCNQSHVVLIVRTVERLICAVFR